MAGTISTVGVLHLTNYAQDEKTAIFDVCRDETGNVHIRINDRVNEIVVELNDTSAAGLAKMIYKAAFAPD